MKLLFRFLGSIALIILTTGPVLANNKVVATVNGKPLTSFELYEEFQNILPMMGAYHGGVSNEKIAEIRNKAMNNLIERELQYQYALEKEIPVSKKEVESELAAMEKRFNSSAKFKDALKKSGIAKGELREFIKKRMLAAKAKEAEVTSKAAWGDAELKDYYEKNKAAYKVPEEFRASHILIGVDPSATAQERGKKLDLAKEVLAKARAGEDFAKLAMRYSVDERSAPIGGDIGTFHRDMAEPSFERAVLSLKVGEVSDIVETIYGYHIIMLTGKRPDTQLAFDEVRDDIKKKFEKKKGDELYKKWIDTLRANAKIEILK